MEQQPIFIDNYELPKLDNDLGNFLLLNFKKSNKDLIKVPLINKSNCIENQCHSNVINYVNMYGGNRIIGYYFIKNSITYDIVAIKHSIWQNSFNDIIDITPFSDGRKYNIFLPYQEAIFKFI